MIVRIELDLDGGEEAEASHGRLALDEALEAAVAGMSFRVASRAGAAPIDVVVDSVGDIWRVQSYE